MSNGTPKLAAFVETTLAQKTRKNGARGRRDITVTCPGVQAARGLQ